MATPIILPPSRRSCEESLASRAWASAHDRRPNNLLHLVGSLLPKLLTPRPFYASMARRAMKSGDPARMLDAIKLVCRENERCRREQAKLHAAMPNLYPKAA